MHARLKDHVKFLRRELRKAGCRKLFFLNTGSLLVIMLFVDFPVSTVVYTASQCYPLKLNKKTRSLTSN